MSHGIPIGTGPIGTGPISTGLTESSIGESGTSARERARLEKAARSFESMLLQSMLKEMRQAQLENGFFGSGPGASVYEGMFESHLAQHLSRESPLGIADALLRSWEQEPGSARNVDRTLREIRAQRSYGDGVAPATDAVAGERPASSDRISRPFGWGTHPIDGDHRFHGGVDLPAPTGTPVVSVA